MTDETALLPMPENREFWKFSEAEKLCAWYSGNFEAISVALHAANPTTPERAEALEALEYMRRFPALAEKFKDLKKFDDAVETIRNALQSPASPVDTPSSVVNKIDGLREAVDVVESGYDFQEVQEAAPEYAEAMGKILSYIRAQLAAQEG